MPAHSDLAARPGPGAPRGERGRRKAGPRRRLLSVPVAGSVAETPRLIEGTEPDLEYAPFDEDDGPVDCDCPAACYRGHRGYRSAPAAAGGGGRWGHPSPLTSAPPPPPAPSHPGPSTGPAARRRPLPRRRRKRKAATGEAGKSCHRPAWDGRRTVGPPGAHPSAGKAPTPHCGPRPSLNPSALTESLPLTELPPQEPLPFTRPLAPLSTHPHQWHSPAPELGSPPPPPRSTCSSSPSTLPRGPASTTSLSGQGRRGLAGVSCGSPSLCASPRC